MVAAGVDEDLRLVPKPAERLRVHNAVPVTLERRPQPARFLLACASACLVGAHRERRQPPLLVVANARLEGVGNPSGGSVMRARLVAVPALAEALGGPTTTPTLPGVWQGIVTLDGQAHASATDPCRTRNNPPTAQMMIGTVPPSALHAAPVTYDAHSEQRKAIARDLVGLREPAGGRPAPSGEHLVPRLPLRSAC